MSNSDLVTEAARASRALTFDEAEQEREARRALNLCRECQRTILSGEFYGPSEDRTRKHLRCIDWTRQDFPADGMMRTMRHVWRHLAACAADISASGAAIAEVRRRWPSDRRASDTAEAALVKVIHLSCQAREAVRKRGLERLLSRLGYSENGEWWVKR